MIYLVVNNVIFSTYKSYSPLLAFTIFFVHILDDISVELRDVEPLELEAGRELAPAHRELTAQHPPFLYLGQQFSCTQHVYNNNCTLPKP